MRNVRIVRECRAESVFSKKKFDFESGVLAKICDSLKADLQKLNYPLCPTMRYENQPGISRNGL